jgi:ABC-2 type transport system permease protein
MNGARQSWLVAVREIRERGRSRAFLASLILLAVGVAAVIVLPTLLDTGGGTKAVGLAGSVPTGLVGAIQEQGDAVGTTVRTRRYDTVVAGQEAVRDGEVDVLVVDAQRLEWQRRADEHLQAVVTGAIQLVAVQERATAAGISPDDLLAMVAPVPVGNVEMGRVTGRSADDENAAFVLTLVLFMAISTYGAMVLSGVVEEKSSRTVEVLLARMPARNLLAGKIAGIGLLGLAQISVTALAAIVAGAMVDSVDMPAARGAVIAWAVVWFVLGYALYATVFGTLGSLASRTEDASSVSGPVSILLVAGFVVSFAAIGSPETMWARMVSWFPATAPFAMPNRIAMGVATWWDPLVAALLTLAGIAGLVVLGGRVYTGAILHTGATLGLRDAWRGPSTPRRIVVEASAVATAGSTGTDRSPAEPAPAAPTTGKPWYRSTNGVTMALIGLAVAVGAALSVITHDVVIGLAAGAVLYAATSRVAGARADAHR